MAVWRESVFAAMQCNAERSASSFCIPGGQAVEVGLEIAIQRRRRGSGSARQLGAAGRPGSPPDLRHPVASRRP